MRLDHADYIKLVIETYHKKRANNELSPLLAQSTPANIRKACLNTYQQRYDKKDEQVLIAFFGPAEHGRQFLNVIRDFETNKFKPLDNYLKGKSENTDDTNLQLLAWLIDFRHRPFVFGMDVTLNEEELQAIGKSKPKSTLTQRALPEESDTEIEDTETLLKKETAKTLLRDNRLKIQLERVSKKKEQGKQRRRIIITILIASACVAFFIWQQERNRRMKLGIANRGCMYWAEDHYEAMPCNEEAKGRLKLPMDLGKMRSFKKILQVDTITERSIGKVYYIKIDGRIEFYTTGGNHPVDVVRVLKPISRHIYDTYLSKQKSDENYSK